MLHISNYVIKFYVYEFWKLRMSVYMSLSEMCYAFESVEIFWAWDAPSLVAKALMADRVCF